MLLKRAVDNFAFRLDKSEDVIAKKKIEDDILVSYATIVERKMGRRTGVVYGLLDSILLETEKTSEPVVPTTSLYGSVKVTKLKVPRAITAPQQDCGYTVSSKDGSIPYSYIRPERIRHRHRGVSKFIADNPTNYFTFVDRKIYIYGEAKVIRVSAIFADPREIALLKQTDKTVPIEVHIDNDLFRAIKQLMIEEYPEYSPLKDDSRDITNKELRLVNDNNE